MPHASKMESYFELGLRPKILGLRQQQSREVDEGLDRYNAELETIFGIMDEEEDFAEAYDAVADRGLAERMTQVKLHSKAMELLIQKELKRFKLKIRRDWRQWRGTTGTKAADRNKIKAQMRQLHDRVRQFIELQKKLVLMRSNLKLFIYDKKDQLIHPQDYYGHKTRLREQHDEHVLLVQQLPNAAWKLVLLEELHSRQWVNFEAIRISLRYDFNNTYTVQSNYIWQILERFEGLSMSRQLAKGRVLYWCLTKTMKIMEQNAERYLDAIDWSLENRLQEFHEVALSLINQ